MLPKKPAKVLSRITTKVINQINVFSSNRAFNFLTDYTEENEIKENVFHEITEHWNIPLHYKDDILTLMELTPSLTPNQYDAVVAFPELTYDEKMNKLM